MEVLLYMKKVFQDSQTKWRNNFITFILSEKQIKIFGGYQLEVADGVLVGRGDKSNDYKVNQKQSLRSLEYAQTKAAVPLV